MKSKRKQNDKFRIWDQNKMGYNGNEIEIGDILRYKPTNTCHIVKNIKCWNKGLAYKITISPSLYYAYNGEFFHEYWNDSYIDNGMVKL